MDDLGQALTEHPGMRMLGGGNPAAIPEVQAVWRGQMQALLEQNEGADFDKMLGHYDPPRGHPRFLRAVAGFLNREYGWDITPDHLAVTPGGQMAFFYLFNLLAGRQTDGSHKKILLPLCPEYIGYANQGLSPDFFRAVRPVIEEFADGTFKYHVDFDRLVITPDIAAVCVSRPTNPTGNVLDDEEMQRLRGLCATHGIPLIVDNAYGHPFPGVLFKPATLFWDEHTILIFSLSKLGLPGARTGILVARPEVAQAVVHMHSSAGLANNNLGRALATPMLEDGSIRQLSEGLIRPFYEQKSRQAKQWLHEALSGIPHAIHRPEGAFFLWLWLKNLRITSAELYQRLKERNVLVVSGHYFFFGMEEPWDHADQCLRLTISQPDHVLREAFAILAEEVHGLG